MFLPLTMLPARLAESCGVRDLLRVLAGRKTLRIASLPYGRRPPQGLSCPPGFAHLPEGLGGFQTPLQCPPDRMLAEFPFRGHAAPFQYLDADGNSHVQGIKDDADGFVGEHVVSQPVGTPHRLLGKPFYLLADEPVKPVKPCFSACIFHMGFALSAIPRQGTVDYCSSKARPRCTADLS
jgi:hypothetical protein